MRCDPKLCDWSPRPRCARLRVMNSENEDPFDSNEDQAPIDPTGEEHLEETSASADGQGTDSDHDDEESSKPRIKGPIPRELFSEYEERPFKICTRCGESLIHFEEGYRVSKIYKAGEVIFEYALCVPCVRNMMEESSEESRNRLFEFQFSRLRDVDSTDECALCERTRAETRHGEFGLAATCCGEGLIEAHMMCSYCMEEMSELVSDETRRGWNRFVEENFPGVPADFEPFPVRDAPAFL